MPAFPVRFCFSPCPSPSPSGYYVDFSRTFTAGYGLPGFQATEKQKKHYKLAMERGDGPCVLEIGDRIDINIIIIITVILSKNDDDNLVII